MQGALAERRIPCLADPYGALCGLILAARRCGGYNAAEREGRGRRRGGRREGEEGDRGK